MLTGRKPVRLNQLGHSSLIIYFNLKKPLKNQKQSMGYTPPGKEKAETPIRTAMHARKQENYINIYVFGCPQNRMIQLIQLLSLFFIL